MRTTVRRPGLRHSSGSSSSLSSSSASSSDYWDEGPSDESDACGPRLAANDGSGGFRRTSTATSATSASSSDDEGEGKALATAALPATTTAVGRRRLDPTARSDPRSAAPAGPTPSTFTGSSSSSATQLQEQQQQQPTAGPSKVARPAGGRSSPDAATADLELGLLGDEVAFWEDEILRSTSPDRLHALERIERTLPSSSGPSSSPLASAASRTRSDRLPPGQLLPLHATVPPASASRWRSLSPDDASRQASSRPRSLLEALRQALVQPSPAPFEASLACSLLHEASLPLLAPSPANLLAHDDEYSSAVHRPRAASSQPSASLSSSAPSTRAKVLRSAALIVFPAVAYFTISVAGLALAGNLFFLFGRALGFYTAAYRACFWLMVAIAAGLFYYCGVRPLSFRRPPPG